MIRVTDLRKRFGNNEILKGISFEVPPQTVLGVIGASGSGKSTLLRCLNGLETIDGGTIDFDKFALSSEGLIHKRNLLGWSDIERISLDRRGILLFKVPSRWWSPRFNLDTIPNAALLIELLSKFGGEVCEA